MTGRAAGLLVRTADDLTRSSAVPLLRAMADGTIDTATFTRYLAIEQGFVRTAVRMVGFCIAEESDWQVILRHAAALADLVGAQTAYFADRVPTAAPLPEGADALALVVTDAMRTDGYPATITCLCAAETLYAGWCGAVERPSGLAGSWIAMHATPAFRAQATFLQGLVDRIDPAAFPDDRLDHWFRRTLDAEDRFHAAALHVSAPSEGMHL